VFTTLSALLFGTDSGVSDFVSRSLNLTELSFSRKQETRADEYALEILNCAFGHVAGSTDFFQRIPKEKDPGKFGHYFASHPKNRRRIAHLEALIRTRTFPLGLKKPLPEKLLKDLMPGRTNEQR
jgi:predicted Zn-dependent protease